MNLTFIFKDGTIRNGKLKTIGASWEEMHNLNVDKMRKEEHEFLTRYGLKTTIFNVSNLRKYGAIQLYPHNVETAIKHGAKDLRMVSP